MPLVSFPLDGLNVHLVSFGSLSTGLSLVTAIVPRPEFANIMYDIGSVRIDLLKQIAYLNFGPAQSSIIANVEAGFSMGSAIFSSHRQLSIRTGARCLRNHKISLSSRIAACPNNHPSFRRLDWVSMLLGRYAASTTCSRSPLARCRTVAACRGHPSRWPRSPQGSCVLLGRRHCLRSDMDRA